MTTIAKILGLSAGELGQATYAKLCGIYPNGAEDDARFECILPYDDTRVKEVLATLRAAGFSPMTGRTRASSLEFWFKLERTYSPMDLREARYLTPTPTIMLRSYTRTPEGSIELEAENIVGEVHLGSPNPPWIVVSDALREEMTRSGMRGPVFHPTKLDRLAVAANPLPFWELSSNVILPPLSAPCVLLDAITGEQVTSDYPGAFVFREGLEPPEILYTPAEMHYTAESLKACEPFDVARTYEQFTGPHSRKFVCSQRFYQFCTERGLKIEWTPVRIDHMPQ